MTNSIKIRTRDWVTLGIRKTRLFRCFLLKYYRKFSQTYPVSTASMSRSPSLGVKGRHTKIKCNMVILIRKEKFDISKTVFPEKLLSSLRSFVQNFWMVSFFHNFEIMNFSSRTLSCNLSTKTTFSSGSAASLSGLIWA